MEMSHGLVDGLNTVSHREFVDNLLRVLVEVDFPRVVAFGLWELHEPHVLLAQIVENVLVKTGVLNVIWRHLLLSLNLN